MGQRKLNTKTNFFEHILFTNIFCTHILIPNSLHTLILAPSSIKNQSNIAIVLVSLDWYLTPKYCWKQDWLANHNRPYRNWIWEFSQNHTSGWNKNKKMHQISLCVQILTHFFLLLFRHFFLHADAFFWLQHYHDVGVFGVAICTFTVTVAAFGVRRADLFIPAALQAPSPKKKKLFSFNHAIALKFGKKLLMYKNFTQKKLSS